MREQIEDRTCGDRFSAAGLAHDGDRLARTDEQVDPVGDGDSPALLGRVTVRFTVRSTVASLAL